jgi:carboxymethylenebutenolidase
VTEPTTGSARALGPASAQTITTDSNALVARDIRISTPNGDLPGYLAHPATGTGFPVVLVIHEIFGVHEHIKDVCRRFAKLGFLAVAPELFARLGNVSAMEDIKQVVANVVNQVADAQVIADLDATVRFVGEHTTGDVGHLAVTGFCWGGRMAWLYCAHNSRVKAGVAWYGKLTGPTSQLQPRHPIDTAVQLNVPVLGLYGGKDTNIPLDSVDCMKRLLATGGSGSDIHVYVDAPHAFFADYRPSYRSDAAADGWRRLLDWLARHGATRI